MFCVSANPAMYAHPDLECDITYLHGIWFLVRTMRTIAHDLHESVVVAIGSYTLHIHTYKKQ